MRIIGGLAILLFASAHSEAKIVDAAEIQRKLKPETQKSISIYERSALRGDYQAMRNIAFLWSTEAAKEQPDAAIVGCAWYATIMIAHKSKAHAGDNSNRELYCGRLSPNALLDAASLSNRIGKSIHISGDRSIK